MRTNRLHIEKSPGRRLSWYRALQPSVFAKSLEKSVFFLKLLLIKFKQTNKIRIGYLGKLSEEIPKFRLEFKKISGNLVDQYIREEGDIT